MKYVLSLKKKLNLGGGVGHITYSGKFYKPGKVLHFGWSWNICISARHDRHQVASTEPLERKGARFKKLLSNIDCFCFQWLILGSYSKKKYSINTLMLTGKDERSKLFGSMYAHRLLVCWPVSVTQLQLFAWHLLVAELLRLGLFHRLPPWAEKRHNE